jgi:hypothetical protein
VKVRSTIKPSGRYPKGPIAGCGCSCRKVNGLVELISLKVSPAPTNSSNGVIAQAVTPPKALIYEAAPRMNLLPRGGFRKTDGSFVLMLKHHNSPQDAKSFFTAEHLFNL